MAVSQQSPRQDRRRARTRLALVEAGQGLFADRDVDSVSVDEIAAAADVAKGTFYNYFTDKEELAQVVAATVRGEVEAAITGLTGSITDPATRLALAVVSFLRYAHDRPDSARVMLRLFAGATATAAPVNQRARSLIAQGFASGRFRAPSESAAILLLIGAVQAGMAHLLDHGSRATLIETAEGLCQLILHGLGVPAPTATRIARNAVAAVFEGADSGGVPA